MAHSNNESKDWNDGFKMMWQGPTDIMKMNPSYSNFQRIYFLYVENQAHKDNSTDALAHCATNPYMYDLALR